MSDCAVDEEKNMSIHLYSVLVLTHKHVYFRVKESKNGIHTEFHRRDFSPPRRHFLCVPAIFTMHLREIMSFFEEQTNESKKIAHFNYQI